ncbi:MAG: trimethylamine---corrinoid protein Co-methyltransferase [Clostridia bacterium]|nr:trimethylamine---corrinoid protein Co-methyltransferase [Clostridia bacterium]
MKIEGGKIHMKSNTLIQLTPSLRYLSRDQMEEIHYSALEILERTGVVVFHDEALELLKAAGARVEGNLVKIQECLVKRALATVPSRVVMANRDGERCLFLEPHRSYFGTGSGCPYTIDPITGERKKTKKEDIANLAKLCDYLSNIDFLMSMGLVQDKYPEIGYIHEFDALVRNTKKPIIMSTNDRQNTLDIIKMAETVMGGPEQLRDKPILAIYSEATSPLRHAEDAVGKMLACAEKWVPIIHTIGMMSGATAPITLAGALVQGNAELLSALVIHQLKQPGAPFLYGGTITAIDMKTMAHPYGAPEFHVLSAALTEMGSYFYKMPVFSTGGCSDAKSFDEQASAEAAYSLLLEALSGGNLIHDIGYIDSGLTSSPHQIVFSNEMIELIKHVVQGIPFGKEELALDVINKVGPGGHYLAEEHTLRNFRRIFSPELLTREQYDTWKSNGMKTLGQRVDEKVKWIIKEYTPEPLNEEIAKKLDDLIEDFIKESELRHAK